jgi:hypothetical protein
MSRGQCLLPFNPSFLGIDTYRAGTNRNSSIHSPIDSKSLNIVKAGEVAEWSNALDLKSSVPKGTVSSNLTLSVVALRTKQQMTIGKGAYSSSFPMVRFTDPCLYRELVTP